MAHKAVVGVTYLLGLLNIAAGIPKIMQMPQELEFLSALGVNGLAVSILGAIQCLGGVLLFLPSLRFTGGVLAGIGLLVSSLALFVGGNTNFALVS
ncbi:MAG: hypothetical protein AAF438_17835, partial [Pseudomonadota bacterium]